MRWVDLRAEIPWLGLRPFWLSHDDGVRLRSQLPSLGFAVYETAGVPPTTDEDLRRAVAEAMDLADHAEKNWNAFADAFGDHVRRTSEPIALIWMDPASAFTPSLSNGLGIYTVLTSVLGEWNRMGPECHQVELFLEGPDRR